MDKRGGVINAIEYDRWMVTLAGAGGDYPPTDEAGFQEFARSLSVPNLYDAIKVAQLFAPVASLFQPRILAKVALHRERG